MPTQISTFHPVVGLIARAGDSAAREVLAVAGAELARFGLGAEEHAVTPPRDGADYAQAAQGRGLKALIVASVDPALPAAMSAYTPLPVIRVPVGEGTAGRRLPLLWPEPASPAAGGAFATVAIGEAGARNAALFVVSMLALTDAGSRDRWKEFREAQTRAVLSSALPFV